MDRTAMIAFILEEYEQTSPNNREPFHAGLQQIFAYEGELTSENLLEWEEQELSTLYKIVSGMRLTRLHVPNMMDAYASMDTSQLPSRVSFGRIVEEE